MTTRISKTLSDLQWVIESPSLLADDFHPLGLNDCSVIKPSNSEFLWHQHSTEELIEKLQNHLAHCKSHFLGAYFEQLWSFYLQNNPNYELIASNLQISSNGKTLGEFDFIILDKKRQTFIHQELAVKFYLGFPLQTGTRWIGPQTVDRLDIKMERLLSHQLRLSEFEEARAALNKMGIKTIEKQLVIKGYLFQPKHLSGIQYPDYVNPKHLMGSWTTQSRFKEEIEQDRYNECLWKPLSKLEWFSPCDTSDRESLLKSNDLLSQVDFSRPLLLSRRKALNHQINEYDRLFVVADDWPFLKRHKTS